MHMWMWFGFDLGEFMFPGLVVNTPLTFALTWIVLFFVALLFEGSKVYLARVQREALKKLYPYRSDERRNLLNDREPGGIMSGPSTSRNASAGQMSRWASLRVRTLVNGHQSLVFLAHNVVGYLLMLAAMIYNVHLLLAVVFGMMLGYFLFGTKLTRLQMKCFRDKKIICTRECDDMAENTTPPLLDASLESESDFFICRTRTCIQPSHYFPAAAAGSPTDGASGAAAIGGGGDTPNATCYYGAKKCPSLVARAKKMQAMAHCSHEIEKEDSPSVEDAQLLRTERQGCCKKKQEPPPPPTPQDKKCCKKAETVAVVHETKCCPEETETSDQRPELQREDSPQITCCHNAKSSPTESQEQIIT